MLWKTRKEFAVSTIESNEIIYCSERTRSICTTALGIERANTLVKLGNALIMICPAEPAVPGTLSLTLGPFIDLTSFLYLGKKNPLNADPA